MPESARLCQHCATSLAPADQDFCCPGCQAAHAVINACGLSDFYRLRGQSAERITTPSADVSAERDALAAVVVGRKDGLSEVRWHVVGMHCAACVWLLEQLPRIDHGVRCARVSIATGRLTVVFDPTHSSPAAQVRLLGSLGYRAKPFAQASTHRRDERRHLLIRLAIASASALGAMHLSLNLYAGEMTRDLDPSATRMFGLCAFGLAVPGLTYGAAPFYRAAITALRHGRLTMDVSATLVILVGVVASIVNLLQGSRELYFDAVTMFVALLLAGRVAVLAAGSRVANATEALDHLMPLVARRTGPSGRTENVQTAELRPGDRVEVLNGEVVPCDGLLQDAPASIDAAALSGESRPVQLVPGDIVFAGTTCLADHLCLQVGATGAATRMGRVLSAIGDAASRPTALIRIADRLQTIFILSVTAAALGTILVSWLTGGPGGGVRGLERAIALVLVSCPCALGLATPLVQALAVSRAAVRGILVRDAGALEALGGMRAGGGNIRHLVFDKTGTLTEGRLRVVAWQWQSGDAALQEWGRMAVAAAEARSQHPLALAISTELGLSAVLPITEWSEIPGQGLRCQTERGVLCIGNQRLTGVECGAMRLDGPEDTVIAVTLDGVVLAHIACTDPIRPGAAALLTQLRAAGISTHLCSGDDPRVAHAVGAELGFSTEEIHGGMAPEDKADLVTMLHRSGAVAVIGDCVNDAAALARADLAIGLRGGVEAAIASCQVFVARNDAWQGLQELLAGCAAANAQVRLILAISLVYNAAGIVLAMMGVWGPYLCAVAMPLSSITAVAMASAGRYFLASTPDRSTPAQALPLVPPLAPLGTQG